MREILFRGKRMDNGEWVDGSLLKVTINGKTAHLIFGDNFAFVGGDVKALSHALVGPSTVGQYTGLTANGKKIFEGDIIKIPDDYNEFGHNAGEIYEVYFCCGGFRLKPKYTKARGYWLEDDETVEVIGNIHDNPELLEVKP